MVRAWIVQVDLAEAGGLRFMMKRLLQQAPDSLVGHRSIKSEFGSGHQADSYIGFVFRVKTTGRRIGKPARDKAVPGLSVAARLIFQAVITHW